MKKIITIIAMVFAMAMPTQAQILIMEEESNEFRSPSAENGDLSNVIFHGSQDDQANFTPVGQGLAVMTALGACYLLGKRRKSNRK